MFPRTRVLILLACMTLVACDARKAREAEQIARFPTGEIVTDVEGPPPGMGRGLPDCLRAPASVLGRGVCVQVEPRRPDGAWNTPRWGIWTYEYVTTTQGISPKGEPLTVFGDIETTSLGLESQGEYAADKFVGEWTFWHPNGQKRAIGRFVDGAVSGAWQFWSEDGSIDTVHTGDYEHGALKSPTPK